MYGNLSANQLDLLPAWTGEFIGVKIATIFPDNSRPAPPSVHASYTQLKL